MSAWKLPQQEVVFLGLEMCVVVCGLLFVCYFKKILGTFDNDLSLEILCRMKLDKGKYMDF